MHKCGPCRLLPITANQRKPRINCLTDRQTKPLITTGHMINIHRIHRRYQWEKYTGGNIGTGLVGHIMPIHTLRITLCFQYQLFGNVQLKRINSSAVNTTIRERIPLIYYLVTKVYFLTSNLHLFLNNFLQWPLLPPLSNSKVFF